MFGECHAHLLMNARNYKEAVCRHKEQVCIAEIRASFGEYKKQGISFVRDGGDALHVSETARKLAPEYGIDYRTPLFAIHKEKHYGGIVGHAYRDLREFENLVKQVQTQGGDFIKIMISGIMDFNVCGKLSEEPLPDEEIRELVNIAHAYGFAVMVHANGASAVRSAALAGADSIEHGNYIDRDCIEVMAQMGTVWVPTVVTISNLLRCARYPKEAVEQILQRAKDNLQYAWKCGVHLALGSDAGAYLVDHGQGLLDEYEIFCRIFGKTEELDRRLTEGEGIIREKFCRNGRKL